jgi:hypothetical protein
MSKKTVAAIAFLILSPLIIYLLWPSAESRIRKVFKEGAQAVEEEKTDDVMSKVSYNYTDEHGLSYLYLKKFLQQTFGEFSHIGVEYRITGIGIKEGKADVGVDVRVIASRGGETGYVVGDATEPHHIRFFLEKERLKWLVTRTEGLPAGI